MCLGDMSTAKGLFDYLVGKYKKIMRNIKTKRLGGLEVDRQDRIWSAARPGYRPASSRVEFYQQSRRRGGTEPESSVRKTREPRLSRYSR